MPIGNSRFKRSKKKKFIKKKVKIDDRLVFDIMCIPPLRDRAPNSSVTQ